MDLNYLINENNIKGKEESTPGRLIDKAHSSLGKKLVQNLKGRLSHDVIFNNERRQCEIRLFDQINENKICENIIEIYDKRGFKHMGSSSDELVFEKKDCKGYVIVTQSYFPELNILIGTEDFSQFKP